MAASPLQKTSTRDAILDAVDTLMARYGFRKTTMDDIAREAGVSKRTIYLYFKSKEDVGLSSIGRVVEHVHAEMSRLASQSGDREAKLRTILRRRVMGRVEQVQEYAHSLNELFEAVRPEYMARRVRAFDAEIDIVSSVLGDSANLHDRQTAETLILATNAFLPYSLSVRELGSLESIQARLDVMIDTLLNGALNRAPSLLSVRPNQ